MNHTITTTLWKKYFVYLDKESKNKKVTKKSIIEKWLEYYQKYELESKVKQWLLDRQKEYKNNSWDFRKLQFNSIKD